MHFQAEVLGQFDDRGTRDADQRRTHFRLDQRTIFDDEQIFACAFGHKTVNIEQQRLVVTMRHRFTIRQNRIGVGAGKFRARHVDVDVMACVARGLDADAFLDCFFAQICAPRPRRNRHMHGRANRRNAHFFGAVKRQWAQVARFKFVDAHHFLLCVHQLLFAERQIHHVNLGRIHPALGVVGQTENLRAGRRVVGAHALEGGQAIVQRVGQHVGGGFAPGHQLAVKPDKTIAVGHRHLEISERNCALNIATCVPGWYKPGVSRG